MTSWNTLDYHTRISRHAVRESTGDSKRRVGLVSIPIYRAPAVRSIAPQFWRYYYVSKAVHQWKLPIVCRAYAAR